MKRDYYETPAPSRMMQLFWKAAGADKFILSKATYSDQVKYTCLGGIIVATGLMAAIAGGYAFYTIFEPRGSALENDFSLRTCLISMVFGILWGLMIFNLDRFIVSSTGKGDGTEAITWDELKNALPRIILGSIIALTISKPVEIRMFKSEIDAALHEEQLKKRKDYEIKTRANYVERQSSIENDLKKIETERQDLVGRLKSAERDYNDQLNGKVPGTKPGAGPLSKALEAVVIRINGDLKDFDGKNKARVGELVLQKTNLQAELDAEIGKNKTVAGGLDGLLERIKLAHEIAGTAISLFITLLFMAIELTPIFFKLMLTKTPYDYLEENIKELMKAEQGILVEYNYYKDKQGQERDLIIHFEKEKMSAEKKELLDVQKRLTKYALQKYEEEMKAKIDANPSAYVSINEGPANPN